MSFRPTILFSAIAAMGLASAAQANTFNFSTQPGALDTSLESISAKVTFETFADKNYFTVAFSNLSSPLQSVGQAVSGVQFTYGAPVVSFSSVAVVAGQEYSINGAGVALVATNSPWYLASAGAGSESLSVFGHGQPKNTLLPALASYAGANSSIKNSPSHNPFYTGSVTFKVTTDLANTAGLDFRNVQLMFGTAPQLVTAVPEPETYAMMLAGLGIMGAVVRRRRPAA